MPTLYLELKGKWKAIKPAWLSTSPKFNFITVHYIWIITWTFLSSICIYIRGDIHYIDALFFGSGASTQSGLNTVDVNLLTTWQQVVLFTTPLFTNPISINTFVIFLRLYWFEKRFQHVVKEARKGRRSIGKTLSKARTNERDMDREEKGVGGRNITVMHNTALPNGMTNKNARPEDFFDHIEMQKALAEEKSRSSNESDPSGKGEEGSEQESGDQAEELHRPQIKFADQIRPSERVSSDLERMPVQRSKEDHIAFLERQCNPDAGVILRIPGPRDADAGVAPQTIEKPDLLNRVTTRRTSILESQTDQDAYLHGNDDHIVSNGDIHYEATGRNITFTEPTRPSLAEHVDQDLTAAKRVLNVLRFRKPRLLKGEKLHEDSGHQSRRVNTLQTIKSALSTDKGEAGMPYLSYEPTVGRNSQFAGLSQEQREELGGIEYRSLKTLIVICGLYFFGFFTFGIICLTPWIQHSKTYGAVVTEAGQGRPWWGVFTAQSAFSDVGFTLTPDSMNSFHDAIWPLLVMSFLIIIGNTGFPIMLRFVIWIAAKVVPRNSGIWEELQFLLDHPRRCFTLLFPSKATWWLFVILVVLNGLDLFFFIVLDLGNPAITVLGPPRVRVLDGWFQAISTRTAGFGVVDLGLLHPAIQVSYLIMMYISVLPIAISVRRTNVYEERSLGIYGTAGEELADEGEPSYVGAHLRRQLSFDLWYIFLGLFIIAIAEGDKIQSTAPENAQFTMFAVLFEIVSAYGTVGLSLGYPGINASFSAKFNVVSKLVIIAMEIRGRHRGLPYQLDRAILLPSEHLQQKEAADAEQAAKRVRRRSSSGTNDMTHVSSGATKTERTRGISLDRATNFIGTFLHPGPTIPNTRRRDYDRKSSVSSGLSNGFPTSTGADGAEEQRGRKVEGRRHFYQEGVNPPPQDVKGS